MMIQSMIIDHDSVEAAKCQFLIQIWRLWLKKRISKAMNRSQASEPPSPNFFGPIRPPTNLLPSSIASPMGLSKLSTQYQLWICFPCTKLLVSSHGLLNFWSVMLVLLSSFLCQYCSDCKVVNKGLYSWVWVFIVNTIWVVWVPK